MKIIELNKNGVEVGEEENPLALRYFNDNGNLPDGNYDEDDIAGSWILIDGDNIAGRWVLISGEHTNYDIYAYRSIDDTTLIPSEIFRKKLIEELTGERVVVDAEWLEENDPELLNWITSSEYWRRGYDRNPEASEAIVELQFDEGGVAYYANLEANKDKFPSQNQPPWGEDGWDNWSVEDIKKYYEMVK